MTTAGSFNHLILHAVEAHLHGNQWRELLHNFYTSNCPRFRTFTSLCSVSSEAECTRCSVNEADIQMHAVHVEFKSIVEAELFGVISRYGSDEERFIKLLDEHLCSDDETVHRLYETLNAYRDFVKFGKIMCAKCEELYPSSQAEYKANVSIKQLRMCRVLWDLENIHVDQSHGGMHTVIALQEFLRSKGLLGNGIDTRISAFFNPFNKGIPKRVIEELNKASVELVCASAKREDADRKLGMRINQEMQILIPELTTFVIISSDQDFRQHIQLLSNAGYSTMVLHEARSDNWRQALEMHADEGYSWSCVLAYLPSVSDDIAQNSTVEIGTNSRSEDVPRKHEVAGMKKNASPVIEAQVDSLPRGRDPAIEAKAVGWHVAVCQRWASAYGFLLVDTAHPAVHADFTLSSAADLKNDSIRIGKRKDKNKHMGSIASGDDSHQGKQGESNTVRDKKTSVDSVVKVFVHNSAITFKPSTQRLLRAGEYVLAQIELDEKGPKAVLLKDLIQSNSFQESTSLSVK